MGGVNIDVVYLNQLRYVDNVALVSTNTEEMCTKVSELNVKSKAIGPTLNKTKISNKSQQNIILVDRVL